MHLNPERGLVGWATERSLDGADSNSDLAPTGCALVMLRISLAAYRAESIPDNFLARLTTGFSRLRSVGRKAVLRFVYADEGDPADAPMPRILNHIEALKPILASNSDVIAVVQGGFIGMWGEWHTSSHGLATESAMNQLARALLAALPSTRAIQVRTARYKRAITGGLSLPEARAFDGTPAARIGFHNDCVLSGPGDAGTFEASWERGLWAKDARFVPVGGETCRWHKRAEPSHAGPELAAQGFSFLNGFYHPDVLARWRELGFMATLFQRLGYAFEFERVAASATRGGLALRLSNVGFAAPFNPRRVVLHLVPAPSDSPTPPRPPPVVQSLDPRHWRPGKHDVTLTLPHHRAGRFHIGLALSDPALPDRPDYAIAFGNVPFQDGVNWLGVLDLPAHDAVA